MLYVLLSAYKLVVYESGTATFTGVGESIAGGNPSHGTYLSYPIRYSYVVNGIVYHNESSIYSGDGSFEIGDEISIMYDRDNPDDHIMLNFFGLYGYLYGGVIVLGVFYSILFRRHWRRNKKDLDSE